MSPADSRTRQCREMICISCPMGCQLAVTVEPADSADQPVRILAVEGQQCARGENYARDEVLHPKRMVTALVAVPGRTLPLSVRTRSPIPKALIFDCLQVIRRTIVQPPVRLGDCLIANVLDTGVDVIATRDLP